MAKGQFKIQKVMHFGTSNPIVAGLTIGMFDIVKMAQIDQDSKKLINKINLNIAKYLTKAEQISDKVCGTIDCELDKLNKESIKTQTHDRCVNIPHTENLDDVCNFLKYGKKALQEMVAIFNLFLNTDVSGPKYNILLKEIKKLYGEKDPIYLTLKKDHDTWLKHFIDLRNDEEHPENRVPEGKEFYYDFDMGWSEKNQKWIVDFPHFHEGTSVYKLLKASIYNIFTFVEKMNILFLQKHMLPIVEIKRVSEDKIKDYAGKRFIVRLKDNLPINKGR